MSEVPRARSRGIERKHWQVIFGASLGTVFEWYDFYLYGSLSATIASQFFSAVNATTGFMFALLAFAAGFFVRPLGALVFGRLGDLAGRKHAFLITIVIMGCSTALVGVLPSYARIGVLAPIILVSLRLLQGLALGGEYGGAVIYVAEHAPADRRGLYTSAVQTTATLGLFLSLVIILACRLALTPEEFDAWGWRIPFLLSVVLLAASVYIRLRLEESPVFRALKAEGQLSKAPLVEAFGRWDNLRIVLLSLFGATAGQAVVWYAGQFYALFFLEKVLQVEAKTANLLIAGALAIATPFFMVFGKISDRVGRKAIVMAGCLLAAATYFPIFQGLTHYANPALDAAVRLSPVTVVADPAECSFQFDPLERRAFNSSCDIAKSALADAGIPYATVAGPSGSLATVRVGHTRTDDGLPAFEGADLTHRELQTQTDAFSSDLRARLSAAGYPSHADPQRINVPVVLALCTILVLYCTMVYGPMAAWMVELFPARIRYSSMSLPYHLGNGWFGGFLPVTAFAIVAATGDIYAGLWYPVGIAVFTLVVGSLFLPETVQRKLAVS